MTSAAGVRNDVGDSHVTIIVMDRKLIGWIIKKPLANQRRTVNIAGIAGNIAREENIRAPTVAGGETMTVGGHIGGKKHVFHPVHPGTAYAESIVNLIE